MDKTSGALRDIVKSPKLKEIETLLAKRLTQDLPKALENMGWKFLSSWAPSILKDRIDSSSSARKAVNDLRLVADSVERSESATDKQNYKRTMAIFHHLISALSVYQEIFFEDQDKYIEDYLSDRVWDKFLSYTGTVAGE
ncbi:MAG: hypothetical protein UY48_C0006G0037 [Candidatus Gottesmanbacteria bacterium GW2011_GWB1_49_7]|uniref:Uncharacterized protein n=1 Tax=Candidatus Gottesmanbacteria bacterium GW2011_GWB1_49_7 TaxID=1618448 RepID=A0A0G1Z2J0_9BACT|nr:MAG: hypothetical protein UY48_C0006G0037 [Candidatus Gottesmanbacteria bacterium GW2011_GWB1_49_7]